MRNAKRTWGWGEDLKSGERDVHGMASIGSDDGCVTGDVAADNVAGTATGCAPYSYYPILLVVPVIDSFKARV